MFTVESERKMTAKNKGTQKSKGGELPNIPRPLFIVYCRICHIETFNETVTNEELAAAHRILREICCRLKAEADQRTSRVAKCVDEFFQHCHLAGTLLSGILIGNHE